MSNETRQCQNCKNQFAIESEDFDFYKKISVPPPTFCPECRLQRRLAWRNERGLSKRKCSAPGHSEDIISIYSDPKLTVYDHEYWWGDAWDALAYGKEFDFAKPFFVQFRALLERTPLLALFDSKSANSSYCNHTVEHKNCYLVTAGWNNEDSCYSNRISFCKDTMDSYVCHKTEFGYENVYCKDSYRLFFSRNSHGCNNSYFLYDCRGCSDCICCTGLRNKQYHIFNQPYSKEEYEKKVKELNVGSSASLARLKVRFGEMYAVAIHKYAQILKSVNTVGDNIEEAKNCYWCFDVGGDAEDSKYCNWVTYGLKDCYDSGPGAGGKSELTYESVSIGVNNARCSFSTTVWYSHDVQYSYNCHSCQNCFGCASLRNKQYCILNKQYSKEEYEAILPRIIQQMYAMPYTSNTRQGTGGKEIAYRYGEFFPMELSPFRYNDTIAQEFFPLSEEAAREAGLPWYVPEQRQYSVTIRAADLADAIEGVPDAITKEIIECAHQGKCGDKCATAFRIVPQELLFYRKFNLPLPRLCPNCRHAERVKQRNPMKLWHRSCQCTGKMRTGADLTQTNAERYKNTVVHSHGDTQCPNEFETTYSPERAEIVYCEACYQSEVV